MRSFEEMKELRYKKNILGLLITVCGLYIVITSLTAHLLLGLILGIVMMIVGLFFMEMLIKGSSLVFSGVQLLLFDQLLFLIDHGLPNGTTWVTTLGVAILIVGIILVIIGYRE